MVYEKSETSVELVAKLAKDKLDIGHLVGWDANAPHTQRTCSNTINCGDLYLTLHYSIPFFLNKRM